LQNEDTCGPWRIARWTSLRTICMFDSHGLKSLFLFSESSVGGLTFLVLQRLSLVSSRPKHQVHPRTNPHRSPPASHQTAKTIPQLVTLAHQQMLTAGRIATSKLAQVVEMVPHQTLSAGMGQIAAPASNQIKMGQNNALTARVMAGQDWVMAQGQRRSSMQCLLLETKCSRRCRKREMALLPGMSNQALDTFSTDLQAWSCHTLYFCLAKLKHHH